MFCFFSTRNVKVIILNARLSSQYKQESIFSHLLHTFVDDQDSSKYILSDMRGNENLKRIRRE